MTVSVDLFVLGMTRSLCQREAINFKMMAHLSHYTDAIVDVGKCDECCQELKKLKLVLLDCRDCENAHHQNREWEEKPVEHFTSSRRHLTNNQATLKCIKKRDQFRLQLAIKRRNKKEGLTAMLEKIVPTMRKYILGSLSTILLGEKQAQPVVMTNNATMGTRGRRASVTDLCLAVFDLYAAITLYIVRGTEHPKLPTVKDTQSGHC